MRNEFLLSLVEKKIWEKYFVPEYERISLPLKVPVKKYVPISICTNCMGRAEDIKQTYVENIENNLDYPAIEFVLLNYGSKDDLDIWVFKNLMEYIKRGILSYYSFKYPDGPKSYSMTHSRNVSFKVAKGKIVTNVDADHYTNKGFAVRLNELAHQVKGTEVVFVKSKQKNRGRIALYKKEFERLGGYNEDIREYGYDDHDLLMRAYLSGFRVLTFGGGFMRITEDHRRHPTDNYVDKDWRYTQARNALISLVGIAAGRLEANPGIQWGKAHLVRNFSMEIDI